MEPQFKYVRISMIVQVILLHYSEVSDSNRISFKFLLKASSQGVSFSSFGRRFQLGTTLFEKKLRRVSNRYRLGIMFRGLDMPLVSLRSMSLFSVNQFE